MAMAKSGNVYLAELGGLYAAQVAKKRAYRLKKSIVKFCEDVLKQWQFFFFKIFQQLKNKYTILYPIKTFQLELKHDISYDFA